MRNDQKNGCPEWPNPRGGPKQTIMAQKWPFLKPKSKLKRRFTKAVEQKGLYFQGLYQKIYRKTRNFDYFILLFWKNKLKIDTKDCIYSFLMPKGNIFVFFKS